MQFLVVGLDGDDDQAMERRLKARQAHIEMGDKLVEEGHVWYGAALLDDEGKMKGSSFFVDFESEEKLQEWLSVEPYVVGDVWRDIQIHKCNTRDPWQFNRSKEFYLERQKNGE